MEELSGVRTVHAQKSHVRNDDVDALKVHFNCAQRREGNAEYEKYRAKAHFRQLKSGQKRY